MSYDKKTGCYVGYIYCITNNINGKQYIGQTSREIKERWLDHISCSNKHKDNCVFHSAIRKYGENNFSVISICELSSKTSDGLNDLLNFNEKEFIVLYDTMCPHGYNLTRGGDNVSIRKVVPVCMYSLSGEFIKKYNSMVEAEKDGFDRKCISTCCNHHTRMSGGYMFEYEGRPPRVYIQKSSGGHKVPVDCYDDCGNFIKSYKSIMCAQLSTGISSSSISGCCKGKYIFAGGYAWRYYGDSFDKYDMTYKLATKSVAKYSIDGSFICVYGSIKEAAKENNLSHKRIGEVCKKENSMTGGYMWRIVKNGKIQNKISPYVLIRAKGRRVALLKENGSIVKIFNSAEQAGEFLHKATSTIMEYCRNNKIFNDGIMIRYVSKDECFDELSKCS